MRVRGMPSQSTHRLRAPSNTGSWDASSVSAPKGTFDLFEDLASLTSARRVRERLASV